ncbi:hypothetical protein AB6A40_000952 [Gnathostoma spinigerum]|uniref:Clc-like protein n=1 Tax=Gnathostoma spinigerum TaxID=75299 RepID=A0ABD6E343_9BILA
MNNQKSKFPQTLAVVVALALLVAGIAVSIGGIISPSWQVVDIREFQAEHHHGLWQDCMRSHRSRHKIHDDSRQRSGGDLHCTFKFDYNAVKIIGDNLDSLEQNSAAGEAEHHQFFGWHKAVLICAGFSIAVAALALCLGVCAPCNSACALLFTILVFVSLFFSVVADGIFFFAAHRVDSRFVQGLVGTYEQEIGYAFYMHGSGTILLLISMVVASAASYQLLTRAECHDPPPMRELAPLYTFGVTN